MSGGPLIKLPPAKKDNARGGWFTFTDDGNAVISPPPAPALFTYRQIDPVVTPAQAPPIRHAACVRSDGFSGFVALEGFDFQRAPPDYQTDPLDVSRYTGIRFWASSARATPGKLDQPTLLRVQFSNLDTYTENAASTCFQESGRNTCDDFGADIALPNDGNWALYAVKWADLTQQGYGHAFPSFDTHVYTAQFAILGPGRGSRSLPFDFCVAQIEFTRD